MDKLREHYEQQLTALQQKQIVGEQINNDNNYIKSSKLSIGTDLIGGERAHDIQLREKHRKKKADATRRLASLAAAFSQVEHSNARDVLQEHYTDIHRSLQDRTEAFRAQRQRVRALEREVADLQAEFQLDRADYLETIRRLEKSHKFFEQLLDRAVLFLRGSGRFWDVAAIQDLSTWNDDLHRWKLADLTMTRIGLPPAAGGTRL